MKLFYLSRLPITKLVGLIAISTLAPHCMWAQESSSNTRSAYTKTIDLPTQSTEQFASIVLDEELYSGSTESYSDLRILDAANKEIPYLVHRRAKEKLTTRQEATTISKPQVRPLEDNRLEIIFTIDREKHAHSIDGLALKTSTRDFEHRVSVETRTSDNSPWHTLVTDALIYDYSRYMDVRNLEIPFTEKSSNTAEVQFRVLIEKVTQEKESQFLALTRTIKNGVQTKQEETLAINRENLYIDSLSFWQKVESVSSTESVLVEYPIQIDRRSEDEKNKSTVIEFSSKRQPLSHLQVITEDSNFHRKITLYAVNAEPAPDTLVKQDRVLTHGSITKISLPKNSRADLAIAFPATRSSRYRLVIENGDSPPLKDITLKADGETYELLFLMAPNQNYSLTYGNPLLKAPNYDLLALRTALDSKIPAIRGRLGDAKPIDLVDPRPTWEKLIENRLLLGGLFTLLLGVLAWTLYQASKRLASIEPT
jgi:hypothetical protein